MAAEEELTGEPNTASAPEEGRAEESEATSYKETNVKTPLGLMNLAFRFFQLTDKKL